MCKTVIDEPKIKVLDDICQGEVRIAESQICRLKHVNLSAHSALLSSRWFDAHPPVSE
jgi:hypothetical protein